MDILKKLTKKNLKLNKKRTIGTIIGIVLSTAMICAVATMVTSFRKTMIEESIKNDGYYHLILNDVDKNTLDKLKNNKDFSAVNPFYEVGFSAVKPRENIDTTNMFVQIVSASKKTYEDLKYDVIEGRMPESNNEIVLTKLAMDYLDVKLGDTINLEVGKIKDPEENGDDSYHDTSNALVENQLSNDISSVLVDTTSKTYKVVGVTTVLYNLKGFTTDEVTDNMDVYLTLDSPKNYKSSIAEVLGISDWDKFYKGEEDAKYNYTLNTFLLHLEVFSFSEETTAMLLTIAGIVIGIIMVASIFCIRNSFAISTIEKMKMYGMLASVGATKKQIRKSVIYEGILLGLIAIPIGVVGGLLGDLVLFKVVNLLLSDFIDSGIVFDPSIIACVIAVVLAFLTIFLSSLSSARKASKVSPIENLRSSKEVMIKAKKLKTPKIIDKVFKTGGVLAFKNLKRSKKKYRTTVISLTVSIFVFISLSYFISAGFEMTSDYYRSPDYNIAVYPGDKILSEEDIKVMKSFKDVKNSYLLYHIKGAYFKSTDLDNIKDKDSLMTMCKDVENEDCEDYIFLEILVLDEDTFKAYAKKNGAIYDKVKDKAILFDTYYHYDAEKQETSLDRMFAYEKNDKMKIINDDTKNEIELEIGAIAEKEVYGYEMVSNPTIALNKAYVDKELIINAFYIESDDAYATAKEIEDYDKSIHYTNYEETARANRTMVLVISIFLYGFIALITLIGVTNIFNTITANMDLRAKEFAMLKSIGMTKKEFNRMISLETLFYSTKSLLYGIVLGLIGCLLIRKAFNQDVVRSFVPPYTAIIISIIFVFAIVYIIMRYSIRKINKQNTIETIRKENV